MYLWHKGTWVLCVQAEKIEPRHMYGTSVELQDVPFSGEIFFSYVLSVQTLESHIFL